jgi:hypothetical protein
MGSSETVRSDAKKSNCASELTMEWVNLFTLCLIFSLRDMATPAHRRVVVQGKRPGLPAQQTVPLFSNQGRPHVDSAPAAARISQHSIDN